MPNKQGHEKPELQVSLLANKESNTETAGSETTVEEYHKKTVH